MIMLYGKFKSAKMHEINIICKSKNCLKYSIYSTISRMKQTFV